MQVLQGKRKRKIQLLRTITVIELSSAFCCFWISRFSQGKEILTEQTYSLMLITDADEDFVYESYVNLVVFSSTLNDRYN